MRDLGKRRDKQVTESRERKEMLLAWIIEETQLRGYKTSCSREETIFVQRLHE